MSGGPVVLVLVFEYFFTFLVLSKLCIKVSCGTVRYGGFGKFIIFCTRDGCVFRMRRE